MTTENLVRGTEVVSREKVGKPSFSKGPDRKSFKLCGPRGKLRILVCTYFIGQETNLYNVFTSDSQNVTIRLCAGFFFFCNTDLQLKRMKSCFGGMVILCLIGVQS